MRRKKSRSLALLLAWLWRLCRFEGPLPLLFTLTLENSASANAVEGTHGISVVHAIHAIHATHAIHAIPKIRETRRASDVALSDERKTRTASRDAA